MTAIFVSYSRKNADVSYEIAEALRTRGYTVWTDVGGITGGAVWQSEIEDAITNCDIMIVMMSPAARESDWVKREILFALDLQKTIIPLIVEDVKLPFALYDLQPIDYRENHEQGLAQLVIALSKLSNQESDVEQILVEKSSSNQQAKGMSLLAFRRMLLNRED